MPEQVTDEELNAGTDGLDAFDDAAPSAETPGAETPIEKTPETPAEETPEGGESAPVETPAETPTTGLDEAAMVRILKAANIGQQPPAPQVQNEPQMTQEEFDTKFNVFKPTVELIEAIRTGGDAAVAAMQQVALGINKQATTMMGYQMAVELQKLKQSFAADYGPAREYAQQQQMAALKTDFFKTNPDLQDYEVLAEKIVNEYTSKGHKFASKEDAFKVVATDLRNTLKSIGVVPKARTGNGAVASGAVQQKPMSRMSTVSTGGQGAGNTGGGAKNKNPNVSDGLDAFE